MNKKQKNRKIVTQNNRNRMINRRYTSTIKTLFKLLTKKIKNTNFEKTTPTTSLEIAKVTNSLYSIIDKSVKKGIIHKNTAARKKSRVDKIFKHNIKFLENSLKI